MKLTLLLCALALFAVANAANLRTSSPDKCPAAPKQECVPPIDEVDCVQYSSKDCGECVKSASCLAQNNGKGLKTAAAKEACRKVDGCKWTGGKSCGPKEEKEVGTGNVAAMVSAIKTGDKKGALEAGVALGTNVADKTKEAGATLKDKAEKGVEAAKALVPEPVKKSVEAGTAKLTDLKDQATAKINAWTKPNEKVGNSGMDDDTAVYGHGDDKKGTCEQLRAKAKNGDDAAVEERCLKKAGDHCHATCAKYPKPKGLLDSMKDTVKKGYEAVVPEKVKKTVEAGAEKAGKAVTDLKDKAQAAVHEATKPSEATKPPTNSVFKTLARAADFDPVHCGTYCFPWAAAHAAKGGCSADEKGQDEKGKTSGNNQNNNQFKYCHKCDKGKCNTAAKQE